MTDELRKMAEEVGISFGLLQPASEIHEKLEAFARLVADDAAKICDEQADISNAKALFVGGFVHRHERDTYADAADRIRAKYGVKP